jgi:FemAB-related protein (PEP-CTERM system-associated)
MPVNITASVSATITAYSQAATEAWDQYVLNHPNGTVFHLTAWKRAIESCFGFKACYLYAEEAGAFCGILPLFLCRNLLQGKSLISTPFAVYGGPCGDSVEVESALRSRAIEMARELDVQYLELREQKTILDTGLITKELYVTFDLELPRTADELQRIFPRDTRYMIRKAEKNGLHSIVNRNQLDTFYEIYARSFHNLGTPVFPRKLFRAVFDEFGDQCELTTVWREKKALASVISFHYKDWILPYFGGSLLEGRQYAANNFMYWEVMKRAQEMGIRHFDFGRSKLGSGSYSFKTSWNMRERPLPYQFALVRRKTMPNFSPANPKFKVAISAWRSMPFGMTKVLGPALVHLFP